MPQSEPITTFDNDDDEITNTKNMDSNTLSNTSKTKRTRLTFPFGACRVCSGSATGIHYGIATCEGCKGFFKRSILRKEKYRCYFDNTCLINVTNRNRCKACRFRRCIDEGMSVDGVKMGRIPKIVKEKALKELKEQQMKEAILAETNDGNGRESSCSSLSDRSIENYDPNAMEIDCLNSQVSSSHRCTDPYSNDNFGKHFSIHSDPTPILANLHHSAIESHLSQQNTSAHLLSENQNNIQIFYRTNYETFLPDDFTADETNGIPIQSTGFLDDNLLKHMKTIATKLRTAQSNLAVDLNEHERGFIRYLRRSAYGISLRRSKLVKQLTARMNHMLENNIQEYPGDHATLQEFYSSIQLSCKIYTRSTVVYVQELPGMKNLSLQSLEKIILHRSFDWFLLKFNELFHDNGQCYFLAPNGFQFTRDWQEEILGKTLCEESFRFCRSLRALHLEETELSLVLPLHICCQDSNFESEEILQMLRSCYLYSLYTELCQNRGEIEGKRMCSRILQVLEQLIPIGELYRKDAATQILEV